jgi:hypothetical protein
VVRILCIISMVLMAVDAVIVILGLFGVWCDISYEFDKLMLKVFFVLLGISIALSAVSLQIANI